jgi:hypothetical protein
MSVRNPAFYPSAALIGARQLGLVENLWMERENPVDKLIAHIFLCRDPPMIVQPTANR